MTFPCTPGDRHRTVTELSAIVKQKQTKTIKTETNWNVRQQQKREAKCLMSTQRCEIKWNYTRQLNLGIKVREKNKVQKHILSPWFHLCQVQKLAQLNDILWTVTNIWGNTRKERKGITPVSRTAVSSKGRGQGVGLGGKAASNLRLRGSTQEFIMLFLYQTHLLWGFFYYSSIFTETTTKNTEDCQSFQFCRLEKVSHLYRVLRVHEPAG